MSTDPQDESLFKAIVEAAPDALLSCDFSGNIRFANQRAGEMFGYDNSASLAGLNIPELSVEKGQDALARSLKEISQNKPVKAVEAIFIRKNGSTFKAELTGSVLRDSLNAPTGLVTIIRDITSRDNQLKDAFISSISYEIRTPLNAILGFIELIREETENDSSEDFDSYFSIIELSCGRLIQVVDMILNLSRLQSGMFIPEKKTVNPESVIQELIAQYQPAARQKSLSLTFENQCGPVQLFTDMDCLNQPISIILDNAIKYTRKGSIRVTMRKDLDNCLLVEISDTGSGMGPEYINKIFEPFTQLGTGCDGSPGGLGLSLSIAQKLLETIGSEISVVSRPGEGSVFTIMLPSA